MDEQALFTAALERAPAERSKFLDEACGANPHLRNRLDLLLRLHENAGDFLERPAGQAKSTSSESAIAERPGQTIGRYMLLEEIGAGGMGIVYRAEQQEPIRRHLALKIIKAGMDTRRVIARFEAERQALALMDHPNITRVLDAGATDSGRPYFVMELVEGISLTEYCDQDQLGVRERLELFVQVCRAVQHAHQKGIIHRDLKPSHLIVTRGDGAPIPKIIDFGIAKAIQEPLTEKTLVTGHGQMIGTPLYMSPEQVDASGLDVDTRSDIYSLGVVLYELLSGCTPIGQARVRSAGYDEIRRLIREEEPTRPSAQVSTAGEAAAAISANRKTDPMKLGRLLRRDLDWIVMKALEKDRARRYQTASDFAQDIERYLNHEPIEARPPTLADRAAKWARRHRYVVVSTACIGVVLLVATTVVALMIAAREREDADRRLRVQEGINDALVEAARLQARRPADGLADQGFLAEARDHLQRAVALAESGPADPEQVAEVRRFVAKLDQEQRDRKLFAALSQAWLAEVDSDVEENRFLREASLPKLREALTQYGLPAGELPPEEAAALIKTRSEAVQREVLAALEEWRALASPGIGIVLRDGRSRGGTLIHWVLPGTPAERDGRLKKGDLLVGIGQGRDGPLTDTRRMPPPEVSKLLGGEPGTIVRLEVVAKGETGSRTCEIQRDPLLGWLRTIVEAVDGDPWRRRVREGYDLVDAARRKAALAKLADEADVERQPVRALTRLAAALGSLGDEDRAIRLLRHAWLKHPEDVIVNERLGRMLQSGKTPRSEEATRFWTAAVAVRPDSAVLRNDLATALRGHQNLEEAAAQLREALRLEPNHIAALHNLGVALQEQGKAEEAIAEYRKVLARKPDFSEARDNFGILLGKQGNLEEATAQHREAIRLNPNDALAHINLGVDLANQGKLEEAIAQHREAIRLNPNNALAHYNLGVTLANQGKLEESVAEYREALARKPDWDSARDGLANVLNNQGKPGEAIAEFREGIRLSPASPRLYNGLAWLLATSPDAKWRQPAEAVKLAARAVELAPKVGSAWNTLGVARYRNRQFREAIDALTKSMDLPSGGDADASDWLFLAMAHWQLEHKEESQRWYRKAIEWMEKRQSKDRQLLRFRAEAEELMGITGKPPGNSGKETSEKPKAESGKPKPDS